MLLASGVVFAGIRDACHTENHDSRVFAVAYAGAIIDLNRDEVVGGKAVYQMPALNYEQAFGEVRKLVDAHPELWERPSREAVTFAINVRAKEALDPAQKRRVTGQCFTRIFVAAKAGYFFVPEIFSLKLPRVLVPIH